MRSFLTKPDWLRWDNYETISVVSLLLLACVSIFITLSTAGYRVGQCEVKLGEANATITSILNRHHLTPKRKFEQ